MDVTDEEEQARERVAVQLARRWLYAEEPMRCPGCLNYEFDQIHDNACVFRKVARHGKSGHTTGPTAL
jgi:hypothetical protein